MLVKRANEGSIGPNSRDYKSGVYSERILDVDDYSRKTIFVSRVNELWSFSRGV
jgi:hypothetical protein